MSPKTSSSTPISRTPLTSTASRRRHQPLSLVPLSRLDLTPTSLAPPASPSIARLQEEARLRLAIDHLRLELVGLQQERSAESARSTNTVKELHELKEQLVPVLAQLVVASTEQAAELSRLLHAINEGRVKEEVESRRSETIDTDPAAVVAAEEPVCRNSSSTELDEQAQGHPIEPEREGSSNSSEGQLAITPFTPLPTADSVNLSPPYGPSTQTLLHTQTLSSTSPSPKTSQLSISFIQSSLYRSRKRSDVPTKNKSIDEGARKRRRVIEQDSEDDDDDEIEGVGRVESMIVKGASVEAEEDEEEPSTEED